MSINSERLINTLSEAVREKTISAAELKAIDSAPFERLHALFKNRFPKLHEVLECETINSYSLLYKWRGSTDHSPVLFMGHIDIVPASDDGWDYTPFSGEVSEDRIYGRGTIDCKHVVISLLEAVECLIESGFEPRRDIYFFFGHDEECGGRYGAAECVKILKERKISPAFVLDEGGNIEIDAIPGISGEIALPAIAEKGLLSIKFSFVGEGGHASAPPKKTAVGAMADFIKKVEENPFKKRLTPVVKSYFEAISPYIKGDDRRYYEEPERYFDKLSQLFEDNPALSALLHTTAAVTMLSGSDAHNVLPQSACCVLNCRILHGESVESTIDCLKSLIPKGDKYRTQIIKAEEPSAISNIASAEYRTLEGLIKERFSDIPVIPNLLKAATDCRKFDEICPVTVRFFPAVMSAEQLHAMHNVNEYITKQQLCGMAEFYSELMRRI